MAVAKEQIRQIIAENNINSVADVYRLSLNYVFRTAPSKIFFRNSWKPNWMPLSVMKKIKKEICKLTTREMVILPKP